LGSARTVAPTPPGNSSDGNGDLGAGAAPEADAGAGPWAGAAAEAVEGLPGAGERDAADVALDGEGGVAGSCSVRRDGASPSLR